jgi:hypothetical protein
MLTFAQFVLARQRLDLDESGWFQMLVFVLIAVIYGLASIIKAKSAKPTVPSKDAQHSRPTTSPDDPRSALRPPPASPQANGAPPPTLSSPLWAMPSTGPHPKPTAHPETRRPHPTEQPADPSFPISTLSPQTQQPEPPPPGLLAPDDLPTAILHSEILNTPLALRDPLQRPFTDI